MSYKFGGAKRYDVLTHSYDFAYGKKVASYEFASKRYDFTL